MSAKPTPSDAHITCGAAKARTLASAPRAGQGAAAEPRVSRVENARGARARQEWTRKESSGHRKMRAEVTTPTRMGKIVFEHPVNAIAPDRNSTSVDTKKC